MRFVIKKNSLAPCFSIFGHCCLQRIAEILERDGAIKLFWAKSIHSRINKEMDFIINSEFPGKRTSVTCCNLLMKFQ